MRVMNITCPGCGIILEAEEKYIGVKVGCTECGHKFTLWTPEEYLPCYPDMLEKFKPGVVAKAGLPLSFQSPLFTHEQLALALSEEDSRGIFHFSYPLLRPLAKGISVAGHNRYWIKPIVIRGESYVMCKEWSDNNRKFLIQWLRQMEVDYNDLKKACNSLTRPAPTGTVPRNAIRSASNSFSAEKCQNETVAEREPEITPPSFTKVLDWSTLTTGLTIPLKFHEIFLEHLQTDLQRGESYPVIFSVQGKDFCVTVNNIQFADPDRHRELRFTWGRKSPMALMLQATFREAFTQLNNDHADKRGITDALTISCGDEKDHFIMEFSKPVVIPDTLDVKNETVGSSLPEEAVPPACESPEKPEDISCPDFPGIDPFILTSTIIREMLRRKLQFMNDDPFKYLKTYQWCRNTLNLRYPLVRSLQIFESPDDFKETFVPVDGAEPSILICKNQSGLNRVNFLKWVQTTGLSLTDIAELLNVKSDELSAENSPADAPVSKEDEEEKAEECTDISDERLVKTLLTLMYQKKLLSRTDLGNLQTMYFCLNNFGITKSIIQRLYPSMLPGDYSENYELWQSTEDHIHYLILKRYDGLKRQNLLRWAESRKLILDDLCTELHCSRDMFELPPRPETPAERRKPALDCDTALMHCIRLRPGCNEETVVSALLSQGYDFKEIQHSLDRVRGMVSSSGGFSPIGTEPKKRVAPQDSYKQTDDAIRDFVKANRSAMEKAVIDKVAEQGFEPDKVAQRLHRHPDVLTIAGHCYVKDSIADLKETADILLKTLRELFSRNSGYTSAHELYLAVHAQLDDFFYDNDAFESEPEIYQLAAYLFDQAGYEDTHFIFMGNLHIWERKPDYPMGDHGLLILWARENQGILTTRTAYENYKRRGVSDEKLSTVFSLSINKVFDKFWMVEDNTYLLKEKISIAPDFLPELKSQIQTLMAEFDFGFIPMWDIGEDWYAGLPSLLNGHRWTPLLLQSVIRDYGGELGVRTIPRQDVGRKLHAAIVEIRSDLQSYSDLVYEAVKVHNPEKSVTLDRNALFRQLINDGLWPQEVTQPAGTALQNMFKDNIHFHVDDKNTVVVV